MKSRNKEELESLKVFIKEDEGMKRHGGGWKIALADLMTVLMIFFLTAWILKEGVKEDVNRFEENFKAEKVVETKRKTPEKIRLSLKDVFPEKLVFIESQNKVRIEIDSDFLFPVGSADLSGRTRKEILRMTSKIAGVGGFVGIEIQGHTDNTPVRNLRYKDNWELAAARANAIRRIMATQITDPSLYKVISFGSSQPKVANNSRKNRQINRRVVIDFLIP